VEGSCEHGNEPSGSINVGKFLSSCTTGGFPRTAQLHGVSFSGLQIASLSFCIFPEVGSVRKNVTSAKTPQ
jgi:hypothetical protein